MEVNTSKHVHQQPKVLRSNGLEWIDLDLANSSDVSWLKRDSGLSERMVKRFLEPQKAIMLLQFEKGILLDILYTVIGEHPSEDRVDEVEYWIEARRVITVRRGPPLDSSITSLEAEFGQDGAPSNPWELFALAASRIPRQIDKEMIALENSVIDLEDRVLTGSVLSPIHELTALRKRFTYMRRYKAPLARILENISRDESLDMDEDTRNDFKEIASYLMEYRDLVDSFIERANNVRDHIQGQISDRMDKASFRLTILATVFLPPTFLTGLLGINVMGIPGAQHPSYAFWLVCLILLGLAAVSTAIALWLTKR